MKKYLNFLKESNITFLTNLSNEDLQEKLESLMDEYEDIESQMSSIRQILGDRKKEKSVEISSKFPESIFDLDKKQLDFIFDHNHETDKKHYEISNKYFDQLDGVLQSGMNSNTEQHYFNIVSSYLVNEDENKAEINENDISSIRFLGENLKKHEGSVEFGVMYSFLDNYNDKVIYYSDSNIKYGSGRHMTKMTSIESVLLAIAENDLDEKGTNEDD